MTRRAWLLAVGVLSVAVVLSLAGFERGTCVPIPVDPVCVEEGERVFPWDPGGPACCAGLSAIPEAAFDPVTGTCEPLDGAAVCAACGDGACGVAETPCTCPEDCGGTCDGLGEDACRARAGCAAGYVGFCDCTCPGPPGYEGGGCDECGPECFQLAACVPAVTGLALSLDTEGGFSGEGWRDVVLAGETMAVTMPWGPVRSCTAALAPDQRERLLAAATLVDWERLAEDYRSPENPYCCCDQFIYDLDVSVSWSDADRTLRRETVYCDEARYGGGLPAPFADFLDVLDAVAAEVVATCGGE